MLTLCPGLTAVGKTLSETLTGFGEGQAYLGLYRRGWLIWGYVASAWTLMAMTWELGISGLLSDVFTILALSTGAAPILAAWDAYKLARRAREGLA